jgi:hypothetical protein
MWKNCDQALGEQSTVGSCACHVEFKFRKAPKQIGSVLDSATHCPPECTGDSVAASGGLGSETEETMTKRAYT